MTYKITREHEEDLASLWYNVFTLKDRTGEWNRRGERGKLEIHSTGELSQDIPVIPPSI